MLLPLFFLIKGAAVEDISIIPLPDNACQVYPLKINDQDALQALYQSIFSIARETPFCILIELPDRAVTEKEANDLAEQVLPFTFHHKYFNLSHKTPLLFFRSNKDGDTACVSLFRQRVLLQGFRDMDYAHFCESGNVIQTDGQTKWVDFTDLQSPDLCMEAYSGILKGPGAEEAALLFFAGAPESLKNQLKKLMQAEEDLSRNMPIVYGLLRKNRLLATRQRQLQIENYVLKENIDSKNAYHSFYNEPETGYKKKVTEIVKFYRYEYEILPLWYKKFGHLIKVFMGKRTFRSLFNDNVKKYID